jgi:hypothetical protein
MNEQKQQLKHEHRDRMVRIGVRAIEHALLPENSQIVKDYLDLIRNHETEKIAEMVRSHREDFRQCFPASRERCLIRAVGALLELSITEKWVTTEDEWPTIRAFENAASLQNVLIPAYNCFVFESDARQQEEINWQNRELWPRIEHSFQQLRSVEKKLKAA